MLETTFFSTVQINGHRPPQYISRCMEFLTHACCREGKEILFLVSARFLFTLTFVLAYDLASHSGIYPKFLPLAQRINPL